MTAKTYTTEASISISPEQNCVSALVALCSANPEIVLFNRPEKDSSDDQWVEVSGGAFLEEVYALAKGLAARGIEPGDRVALHSHTRYEWALADFSILATGAATVPIYPSSSPHQIKWIIENSGSKIAVTESAETAALMDGLVRGEGEDDSDSQLAQIIEFDTGGLEQLKADGVDIQQEEIDRRVAGITHDTPASIVYTSGTTGRPKGVVLTHLNWIHQATALANDPIGAFARPGNRVVNLLPMAHVLQRAVSFALTFTGTTQTFWSNTSTLTDGLQRFKPQMMLGVPRVFEKVRIAAYNQAADGSKLGKKIFLRAEKTAMDYSRALDTERGPGPVLKAKLAFYDKLVYTKIKAATGGELAYGISGGSALGADLGHFFRGIGMPVYEGYGLTETTAAACVNNSEHVKIGTVGRPVTGYTVRVTDEGEIEFRGDGVSDSYWNDPESTRNAIVDGWFKTGDLGEIDEDGYVTITGRKKDLIVTAGGKNVSPGPLEEIIRQDPIISNALVVGDGKPFISLIVTLDEDELKRWKVKHDISEDATLSDLADNSDLRDDVQKAIDLANATVSRAEAIKKFHILDRDLREEDDEMTPTMKVKRAVVTKRFAKEIDKLYTR